MASQEEQLKRIADQLQGTYEALRKAAANISGLLQVGRATCDEVKAYNLWALAIWNTQRGMLASLRAGGESNVPGDPPIPTLFTWKGTTGSEAWRVNCSGEASSLSGLMSRAMRGPDKVTQYLSTNEMQVSTSDQHAFDPESAPSFKMLLAVQQQRAAQAGLGFVPVLIVIAVVAVAVSVALAAIMHFLEVNEVQEANTEQTKLQADAFAAYTSARLQCFSQCTSGGQSTEDCVDICKKLVDKPNIKIPGLDKPWGTLQWIGFTVVMGAGLIVGWRFYNRRRQGRPVFELPESVEHAINPP